MFSRGGYTQAFNTFLTALKLARENVQRVLNPFGTNKNAAFKNHRKQKTGLEHEDVISILRAPTALSNYLPEIRSLMTHNSTVLSEAHLTAFLESAAPLLDRLGIAVNLPKSLSRELKPHLVLQTTGQGRLCRTDQGSIVSYLDLNSLLEWKWQIAISDRILDLKEFEKLIRQKRTLVRFRDGFVKIDTEELAALLKKQGKNTPMALTSS